MQQRYCDHGRSSALDTTTWPIFFARSSLGIGRKSHERVDLALGKQLLALAGRREDPLDVLPGIDTDVGDHHRCEEVVRAAQLGNGDLAAAQVTHGADTLAAEQFVAADVDPAQEQDRIAGIDLADHVGGVPHANVGLPRPNRLQHRAAERHGHVLRVGKALRT
jgi:hypothetical protein